MRIPYVGTLLGSLVSISIALVALLSVMVTRLGLNTANAQSTLRFVKSSADANGANGLSWDTAYPSIQEAIIEWMGSPASVTEIHVAAGTYYAAAETSVNPTEQHNFHTFALPPGVKIYGGYAADSSGSDTSQRDPENNQTILDGELPGTPHASRVKNVVTAIDVPDTTVLDGFIIQNGFGGPWHYDVFDPHRAAGAGLFVHGGSPQFRNLIVRQNEARYGGGIATSNCAATFENVIVEHNTALQFGGGILCCGSTCAFIDCEIRNNWAYFGGGGVMNSSGAPVFDNVLYDQNVVGVPGDPDLGRWGGAMLNWGSPVQVRNSLFKHNSARHGGAVVSFWRDMDQPDTYATYEDTVFEENSADFGGAIYNVSADTRMNRVSIHDNRGLFGVGVVNERGHEVMTDLDVSGNRGPWVGGGLLNFEGTVEINRARIWANVAGSGGAIYNHQGKMTLVNLLAVKNIAIAGGAISDAYSYDSSIINATISDNYALGRGGGLATRISELDLKNSIVFTNVADIFASQVFVLDPTTDVPVDYTILEGGCVTSIDCSSGTTIDDDPQFIEPLSADMSVLGNYRVLHSSPAIDAGLDEYFPENLPELDLDGNDRFHDHPAIREHDEVIDLGAYEKGDPIPTALDVDPETQTRVLGESATIVAIVEDELGSPIPSQDITFQVTGPISAYADPSNETISGSDGESVFTYTNLLFPGTDTVNVTAEANLSYSAMVEWVLPEPGSFSRISASNRRGATIQISVSSRGGSVSGTVSYSAQPYRFTSRDIATAWIDGNNAVIYGYADVARGQSVLYRIDIQAGGGRSNTLRMRWDGYDSGQLRLSSLSLS